VDGDATRQSLDELLSAARSRIRCYEPAEALAAMENGALLIDIRSETERERDGIVPGSLHIPRTVLEWRLEPGGEWRSPHVGDSDQEFILMCDHGFASSLAAATLVDLGFTRAGDLSGGFEAWARAGLPTMRAPAHVREPDELAGMQPPDGALG
jgi:rhodanese-related sulfurtransferase